MLYNMCHRSEQSVQEDLSLKVMQINIRPITTTYHYQIQ